MTSAVPEGWQVSSIQELLTRDCLFSDGDWVESKDQDQSGTNRLLQLADIGDGSFLDRSNRFMNDEQFARLDCTQLKEGDILIARMPEPIGRACILPRLANRSATVVDVAVLRPSEINNYWLMSVINSAAFRAKVEEQSSGTTRTRIGRTALSRIELLLPPLHEQKKIASILSSVDEVIGNTQKQIDKLQDLKKATMNELLTKGIGHTEFKDSELGRIPTSWAVKPYFEVVKVDMPRISLTDDQSYSPVVVRRRHMGVETRGQKKGSSILVKTQYRAKPGTFLISKRQIFHGSCGLVPPNIGDDAIISKEYLALTTNDELDPRFLNYFARTQQFQNQIIRTTYGVDVEKFVFKDEWWMRELIVVPSIEEQQEISCALDSIQTLVDKKNKMLSQTQSLKKSLMQDLLTGKVRVTVG